MPKQFTIVKMIANLAPWLAPVPSAYFITLSAITHLGLPPIIGIVVGLIVETLGFSTVHLYLMLLEWNMKKKVSDPKSPDFLALMLVIFYLVITVTLTVVLEISPSLATFAPAIFPLLSLIGAFTLALLSAQENKELAIQQTKFERSLKRQIRPNDEHAIVSNLANKDANLDTANNVRKQKKDTLLEQLASIVSEHPELGITELKNHLGIRSRSTVYTYIKELESSGRLQPRQTINSSQP